MTLHLLEQSSKKFDAHQEGRGGGRVFLEGHQRSSVNIGK